MQGRKRPREPWFPARSVSSHSQILNSSITSRKTRVFQHKIEDFTLMIEHCRCIVSGYIGKRYHSHGRRQRVRDRWKLFSDPPAIKSGPAKHIYIKSEGRILGYRVTWSWSERSNLYNSYTPSTNTKPYATQSCPRNLYQGQVCTDHLNSDKSTLELIMFYIRCSTVSLASARTSQRTMFQLRKLVMVRRDSHMWTVCYFCMV